MKLVLLKPAASTYMLAYMIAVGSEKPERAEEAFKHPVKTYASTIVKDVTPTGTTLDAYMIMEAMNMRMLHTVVLMDDDNLSFPLFLLEKGLFRRRQTLFRL